MHPTGPVARRFPLIARPRPACTPLPQRVTHLREMATTAASMRNIAQATAVFNLSALIASDCGMPELARQWCHRLARTALRHHPTDARLGLEPIVNLARLHTRAGDGLDAWHLLETLYRAVASRTDTIIDDIDIPAADLTADPDRHRELCAWLWTVLLADGSRALATAGHWRAANHKLQQLNGIGRRMLDGRQIAVLAHATTGDHDQALVLVRATQPGEAWENAVTACLAVLCLPHPTRSTVTELLAPCRKLDTTAGLAVFRTRLGLSLLDALSGDHDGLAADLIEHAATDGYAARDVLAHPACRGIATSDQVRVLAQLVETCGLDQGFLPNNIRADLSTALGTAEEAIILPT
jgi:hypothetical protein